MTMKIDGKVYVNLFELYKNKEIKEHYANATSLGAVLRKNIKAKPAFRSGMYLMFELGETTKIILDHIAKVPQRQVQSAAVARAGIKKMNGHPPVDITQAMTPTMAVALIVLGRIESKMDAMLRALGVDADQKALTPPENAS